MNIRIVEDSDMLAEMLSVVLTYGGHNVAVTNKDFDWLLAPAMWEAIDVVLCDLWLGDNTTGLDVLKYAAEHHPNIRRVLLTAGGSEDELVGQASEYAHAVMQKPADLDLIVQAITDA